MFERPFSPPIKGQSNHYNEDEICHKAERLVNACNDKVFIIGPPFTEQHRDNCPNIIDKFKFMPAPVYPRGEKRVIPLVDAIAELLVLDAQHETVAVAIQDLAYEKLTRIFVAVSHDGKTDETDRNTTRVERAKAHLEDILDDLKILRHQLELKFYHEGTPVGVNERRSISKAIMALYEKCIRYSLSGMRRRLDKASSPFGILIDLDDDQREEFTEGQNAFIGILLAVQNAYNENEWREMVKLRMQANDYRKEHLEDDISFLNSLRISNSAPPTREEEEPSIDLARQADKLLSLDSNIRRLLNFARSKFSSVLDNCVEIIPIAREWGYLTFNYEKDESIQRLMSNGRPMRYKSFVQEMKEHDAASVTNEIVEVHAECSLVSRILDMSVERGERMGWDEGRTFFPYIGTSRPCCIGCWFFLEALNTVSSQEYCIRGSNGKSETWVAPRTESKNKNKNKNGMENEVLDWMEPITREFFLDLTPRTSARDRIEESERSLCEEDEEYDYAIEWARICQALRRRRHR